jgi:GDP-4-dehydro-6-deoxy-D-mannose reductase
LKHVRKLLATGHRGFVGTALQEFLRTPGQRGVAWCELGPEPDVLDAAALRSAIEEHRPDWVLHLAAQSQVPASWEDPARTLAVNVCGTANLLKVLDETGFRGRLLYVSSSDVYGAVGERDLPVDEAQPPAPRSPYAASKLAAEVLCLQWARTQPLDVVIARPFNHSGPGQRAEFALPAFAREVAAIKRGQQPSRILAGDLDVSRDFLDVRDVVAAYLALLEHGQRGEIYNVCSGTETLLGQALQTLVELAAIDAQVALDPARLRPAEQRRICGSYRKLAAATGWRPRIALRDTLSQLLDYWTVELGK